MRRMILLASALLTLPFLFNRLPMVTAGESPAYAPAVPVTAYYFCTALESPREMPDESFPEGSLQCYAGRTTEEAATQKQNYLGRNMQTPTNAVIETGWTPSGN